VTSADDLARERLRATAREQGYPEGALAALERYVAAVVDENRRINLTGAATFDAALDVLAADSLAVVSAWDASRPAPSRAVDLGTGNGLPGVAVALAWPGCRTTLVERRAKKASAVERCLAAAAIPGLDVVACDGRELVRVRPALVGAVNLVTVRAVGPIADATLEAAPWLAPGGRIVHWKPAEIAAREAADATAAVEALRLRRLDDVVFRAVGAEAPRRLVVIERPL
jgi:16S rRNA G527 N7-methylase RsmG